MWCLATHLGAWSAVTWTRHSRPSNRAVRLADHAPGLRQDAHFVTKEGGGAVGVSDGVSSWAEVGVDAAEYSRQVGPRAYLASSQANAEARHSRLVSSTAWLALRVLGRVLGFSY